MDSQIIFGPLSLPLSQNQYLRDQNRTSQSHDIVPIPVSASVGICLRFTLRSPKKPIEKYIGELIDRYPWSSTVET